MARYRHDLPQLVPTPFLTDGGLETTLVYHDGIELPDFAAFHALRTADGTLALHRYFRRYAEIAARHRTGLILESATWRASLDWGRRLGYSASALVEVNRRAITMLEIVRAEFATAATPVVISGNVGPRGDGYVADRLMSIGEAERYHRPQIATFASTEADLVTAVTLNYTAEAIGIARAARAVGMPIALSLTVETNGKLPTGQPLAAAIAEIDAATDAYPAYYMINCAHPTHFAHVLRKPHPIWERVRGVRANASRKSHAELDASTVLDAGIPEEFGRDYAQLRTLQPQLTILGGCCGTDHRHIEAAAAACAGGGASVAA
jgi:S-methylmethionine-dependent homocysteine/selenocysteine methylase